MDCGGNTTNYSVNKPSYAFSTATTEFDEALIQHGVINRTQALVAKGATVEEAERLLQEEQQKKQRGIQQAANLKNWYDDDSHKNNEEEEDENDDESYDSLLDDADDDILKRYQQLRLDEMKSFQQQDKSRGIVESISRDDWTAKVNEASSRDETQVVICLTTSSARHDFLDACTVLSKRHRSSIFVTLPSQEALPDWPHPEPSILVYRHGKLWREFFRLTALSVEDLETTLRDIWSED